MKLEEQFYHSFYYTFLSGITFSFLTLIIFSIIFTNKYIDKKTGDNIIEMENKFAKVNLNRINCLISSSLLKIQGSLNELINAYQNVAKKVKMSDNIKINITNKFFKSILDLTPSYLEENIDNMEYIAYWIIDENTTEKNLKPNSIEEKQVYSFSNIIEHVYTTFSSTNKSSIVYYFYFDSSELFITYPLINDYKDNNLDLMLNYNNQNWCTDSNGKIYQTYKAKCRDFYQIIQKAKTSTFDYNSEDNINRTIFVSDFYRDLDQEKSINIYTICIQFEDPISNKNAYACADIGQDTLVNSFEQITSKISGYFLISIVGFNHAFYFPRKLEKPLTPSEAIFNFDKKYFVEEKTYFIEHVQKMMTSNYIKNIKGDIWDEVYTNGKNDSEQYFYLNGEKIFFSIIPIVLENLQGEKEHVLSIIYFFNLRILLEKTILHNSNIFFEIFVEIIIFLIFGLGLLYLLILSFEVLAKYIVIPIKNANYMLKGINIGGNNRLEYLDFLKKVENDNAELLESMNFDSHDNNKNEIKSNRSNNNLNMNMKDNNFKNDNNLNETKKELLNDENSKLIEKEKDSAINIKDDDYNNQLFNENIDYQSKYQEENDYIEKEKNFYYFDETLLQNRPLEIDQLIKALIDLKHALIFSSTEQKEDKIINYNKKINIIIIHVKFLSISKIKKP